MVSCCCGIEFGYPNPAEVQPAHTAATLISMCSHRYNYAAWPGLIPDMLTSHCFSMAERERLRLCYIAPRASLSKYKCDMMLLVLRDLTAG